MNIPELIGEIAGLSATTVSFFIFQQNSRKRILLLKLICDLLWVTHFLFFGAFSGMAISLVACFREVLFYKIGTKEKKKPLPLLFFFLTLNVVSMLLTWTGLWSICSLVSGILGTLAYWQTEPKRIKGFAFGVCISQMAYAIAIGSKAAMLNETVTVISIVLFFFRNWVFLRKEKRATRNQENSSP